MTVCNVEQQATLRTALNFSNVTSSTLTLRRKGTRATLDYLRVQVSTNGTSFTTLGQLGNAASWATETFSLTPYAGRPAVTLRFAFLNQCNDATGVDWTIDDVLVTGN